MKDKQKKIYKNGVKNISVNIIMVNMIVDSVQIKRGNSLKKNVHIKGRDVKTMSSNCDDCERVPINEIPNDELIRELSNWKFQLSEENIIEMEEITREWRDNHG